MSSRAFSAWVSGSSLPRMVPDSSITFWADSRLFQKVSADMRLVISPSRFCNWGTSKKPPQVGKFPGGGFQLCGNRFEHKPNITDKRGTGKWKAPLAFDL